MISPIFQEKFDLFLNVIEKLKKTFIGRDEVIDTLACGLISKTNVLLIGEPGTAKSLIVRKFAEYLGFKRGAGFFQYLLTKFTEPSEIIGSLDLLNFRDKGEYTIKTQNRLPEANFVFLDEIFNANSAILNSLLMIINEKLLIIGDDYKEVDNIISVVGASNHTPDDPLLKAFFDRFPIRTYVKGIHKKDYANLIEEELKIERDVKIRENNQNENEAILTSSETLVLVKEFNTLILDQTLKRLNDSVYTKLLNKIKVLKSTQKLEGELFISDRSLKSFAKMLTAHAIITSKKLENFSVDNDSIKFVLNKTWEDEEHIEIINEMFN